jgi:hypothetical protein
MKKYLLVLLALVMMLPSMASAAEHKVVPTFKLQKTTQTMEGFKMSFPQIVGYKDTKVMHTINGEMAKMLVKTADFLHQQNPASKGKVDYKVTLNHSTLLSVLFDTKATLTDKNGAKETLNVKNGMTFNNQGQTVTTADINKINKLSNQPEMFSAENLNAKVKAAAAAGKLTLKPGFKGVDARAVDFYMDDHTNVFAIFAPGAVSPMEKGSVVVAL